MKVTEFAVTHPVSTIVGVLLVTLFGLVAMFRLPIQMKPTVDRPALSIRTIYSGAGPSEVEEQITDKLEEKVNSVEGLRKLSSVSSDSVSDITLEFDWGIDRDAKFVEVLQKLNQVENWPDDADKPVLTDMASDEDRIMWIMLLSDTLTVEEMSRFAKKDIKDILQRVDGVGDVAVYGQREREIAVILDPAAMTVRGLTISTVRQAILQENLNVRGGYIDEGNIRFNARTMGQFKDVAQLKRMVVLRNNKSTVYLEDIARVEDTFERIKDVVRGDGRPIIVLGVSRKIGANVVEVCKKLEEAIRKLNQRFASITYQGRPASLFLAPVYQDADYIWDSLRFVSDNLWMGGLLAVAILIFFLKSVRSTMIIGIVIPICFISTFILLDFFGRTINIISLAGIAFAGGMAVDNAIVVIENIYRHMEMGKTRWQATLDGATEVGGAILASTLTTIAVFLPVFYMKEEAGELFKDIALTISICVGMSLLVAWTVVPMLSARLLLLRERGTRTDRILRILFWVPDQLGLLSAAFFRIATELLTGKYFARIPSARLRFIGNASVKIAVVALITLGSLWVARLYMPSLEYLPSGNRNFLIVLYKPHTGINIHKASEISLGMEKKILSMRFDESKGDTPENRAVESMFAVVAGRFNVIGMVMYEKYARIPPSELPMRVNPMSGKPFASALDYMAFRITMATYGTPGTQYAVTIKPSLFGYRGKGFDIEVRGPELGKLEAITNVLEGRIRALGQQKGFGQIIRDFEVGLPEIHVEIDRERAAALGLKTSEISEVVEVLLAGRETGKFREGSEEFDIMVRGSERGIANIEELKQTGFVLPNGGNTMLENIAHISVSKGPAEIYHKERSRAITLNVNLPEEQPLEASIEEAKKIVADMRKDLAADYSIEITGSASDLERTKKAFVGSFILSFLITYLLMASLFESFTAPFIIMFSVPLAVSGSILGVYWNNVPLDMLTVLGFIILCGIVVNNAILVVHQSLNFRQSGMDPQEAIRASVMSRLRPVFMSTITTILGMLPMCFKGAPGSELYSGLGTAIVGGLVSSTIFTLILVPALLSLVVDIQSLFLRRKANK